MRINQWNTQNSNNVIDKTIQNNSKEFFKNKKNTNKNLADTKRWAQLIILPAHVMSIPKMKRMQVQREKSYQRLTKRKNRKRGKEIIRVRLQIIITTTKTNNENKMNVYVLGDSMV